MPQLAVKLKQLLAIWLLNWRRITSQDKHCRGYISRRGGATMKIKAMQNAAARHDRLSELPDNILLDILERADTLDALRTCILSKRLMRLPAMFSHFDINVGSLTRHHDTASHGNLTITHLVRYNNVLASVTEKILSAKSPKIPTIHKLRVTCYLRPDECLPITRAFADTMATHRVDNAEFVCVPRREALFRMQFWRSLVPCEEVQYLSWRLSSCICRPHVPMAMQHEVSRAGHLQHAQHMQAVETPAPLVL
ncbi:hypothetical protein QYE76_037144 [Lolium multiflorum]|uniref:F-box domain-containing protein n=1 Tax=Lolium multiflorum TaxID=4521 RepID=A0AAD8VDC4_LOLMU|nr:hypothetical protein QYE76_037144 [Lolium multiflorum]